MAVWFQHRPEPVAIDRSLYCHLPARREFPARFLRQAQNCPFVDRVRGGVKTDFWHPYALIHSSHILQSYARDLKFRAHHQRRAPSESQLPTLIRIRSDQFAGQKKRDTRQVSGRERCAVDFDELRSTKRCGHKYLLCQDGPRALYLALSDVITLGWARLVRRGGT